MTSTSPRTTASSHRCLSPRRRPRPGPGGGAPPGGGERQAPRGRGDLHCPDHLHFLDHLHTASSSNMANNEEAGGSGSKPFWMLTDEMEVMESQPRRDDGEDDGTDPEYRADDAAEDDTTDGAAEDDTTDGAAEDDTGAPKKLRRERRPNVLSTVKQAFTEVNDSGHPTAPPNLVKGYSAQLGCILRSTVSINTENLRHPDRANLRTLLFKKLHERYEFPVDCSEKRLMRNKVHNAALTKMSTALASWRNRVKKMINSGASYDKIKESNPSITEQDYADFKIKCESESTSDSSQWGKDMRKLNLGTHKLGPGGFRVAQPKWDAADEERVKNGLEPLFSQYKNKQTRNFLLARYRIDPKTKELTTTPEVKEFEALLAKEIAAESEKEASSGAGSTSSSQCAPWDNPLNRALNAHKKRDPLSKPTSAGRVVGEGCSMKWSEYYKSGKKEKKATIDEKEVAHLKAQVAQIPTLVEEQVRQQVQQIVETQQRTQRQQVEDQVGTTLSSIIPTLVAGLDEWYRGGKKGPPPVPSFTGSNSHNVEPSVSPQAATMVSPAAPTLVAPAAPTLVAPAAPTLVSPAAPTLVSPAAPLLQLNAPVAADNTPPGTAPTSGHSISCTPAAGGASTLAELDAITSSAVDVPCTLLHFVNGELIDVAKAKIVQPSNRQLHGRPMQPDVYRIQLVRVLSGYDDVVPPFQPHGADEDEVLTLQHCFNWSMVWPKSQIRLGARGTTPQTTPPALPAPSHGKTTPTVPPSADEDMQMAQDEDMQMAQDPNDGPYEDSTFANLDCNFDFGVDYDLSSQPSQAAAEGKTYCNKRRLFSSQETPPAADFTETQPIAEVRSVISPNTLKKACAEENAVPVNTKPKGRKRKKKDDKSASQPAPIRAQDGPPVPKNIEARVHVSGERMLIKRLYDAAPGPMRSLVDGIQYMEERRIRERDHGYPVYIAKVPLGHGFVDSGFAEKIFLRYDDIFAMLNSYPLHYTFIRLYSLSKAMRIIRHNIPDIAIADPFYMRAVHLATAGDRAVASGYLKDFFLANQNKCNILLPVFPEDKTCTLISITPKHSMATYLDADGKSTTDYTNVKAVLDDALNGYVKAKGNMQRPNIRYGKHVFKHQTKFPCVKKPPSSNKDAYYALYHMDKFIRDQQQLTLPEHLRDWANKLARVPDDGIKQDFFRIQVEFCEIIHQDVIRSAGEFYAGYQPSNSDIDTMLQMQGDDYRSWMCLKKGGDMTWYVVYKGKVPGVYNDWEECRRQVHRFSGDKLIDDVRGTRGSTTRCPPAPVSPLPHRHACRNPHDARNVPASSPTPPSPCSAVATIACPAPPRPPLAPIKGGPPRAIRAQHSTPLSLLTLLDSSPPHIAAGSHSIARRSTASTAARAPLIEATSGDATCTRRSAVLDNLLLHRRPASPEPGELSDPPLSPPVTLVLVGDDDDVPRLTVCLHWEAKLMGRGAYTRMEYQWECYQLGHGGELRFEKDLKQLVEYLGHPYPEFFGTSFNNQLGGSPRWEVSADLGRKLGAPVWETIWFSVTGNTWKEGLVKAMQEAIARLCGQNENKIRNTRFIYYPRHDSMGRSMTMPPHTKMNPYVAHQDFRLYKTRRDLDNALALAKHHNSEDEEFPPEE
ncbi:hypothetical protein QYE76_023246 [Lolium multiflorum]|uniref:Uncharacterized protein n=1 Tax=Lolium multiflorum TaxID=4521 RepID=A0AAD8RE38_LOLMU|nr:hypothetical protein QYE76_023246 [Lolium multiflorum]